MFKPPKGFNVVQRVSWYVGLSIAVVATVTAVALLFKFLIFVWQLILGVS